MTTQGSPQAPMPEPTCALLVMCAACGAGVEAPLPIDRPTIELFLARQGWFMGVLSPPEAQILLGAICTACAQERYPPEVFKVVEERRRLLLQAAQAPHPQGSR